MPWDRDLAQLERAITALTAEYDAFLYGTEKHPPVASRKNVERMIRKLASTEPDTSATAFKFANLQGHWSKLLERWERLQGEKESGRRPGTYGHFRKSETIRRPGVGLRETSEGGRANAGGAASVRREGPAADDPRRALYEKYVNARRERGEPADGVDFDRFADSLEREKNRLRQRFGGVEVEFDVAERDGRIKLVARKKS